MNDPKRTRDEIEPIPDTPENPLFKVPRARPGGALFFTHC